MRLSDLSVKKYNKFVDDLVEEIQWNMQTKTTRHVKEKVLAELNDIKNINVKKGDTITIDYKIVVDIPFKMIRKFK